jgi:hypothetical protein
MVGNVIMETKARTSPQLNNVTDTLLFYNVRKVGELVLSRLLVLVVASVICMHFNQIDLFTIPLLYLYIANAYTRK